MRLKFALLCMAFFFGSCPVWSSELNFSYTYTAQESSFNLELYELAKIFEEKSFNRLSAFPKGNLPLIHADEVMYSHHHRGSIFIKTNLLAPQHLRYQIIFSKGLVLYHTDHASIAFFDFTLDEVRSLIAPLVPQQKLQVRFFDWLLPTASAAEIGCEAKARSGLGDIEKLEEQMTNSLLVKKIGECAVSAMYGAGGRLDETRDFFNKLLHDPGKLWSEMKENYEQLKSLVANFATEMQSFYATVSGLSLQEQLEYACKLSGEIGVNMVMMATGVGASVGVSRLVMSTLPKLQRLKRLIIKSRRYNFSSEMAKESLSCAL